MKEIVGLAIGLVVIGCYHSGAKVHRDGEEITLVSADKVKVFADYYKSPTPQGIVLMFHQARSSALEYAPIAPTVTAMGYECLAVDLRSGGNLYGPNRTVNALGKSTEYADAYKDMEAALKWAVDRKYKRIFVMGSSFSASLAFKLAANHKDVMGLIVFSPGEVLAEKGIVAKWSSSLKIPILGVCTDDELDSLEAIVQPEGGPNNREIQSSTEYIHGASTLRPEKKIAGTDSIWQSIKRILTSNPSRSQ